MITAQYLSQDKRLVKTKELSFIDMMQEVFNSPVGTINPEDTPIWFISYTYKNDVVLLTSLDDLVPEFNLDAFQKHSELRDELRPLYKDSEIDLYINLKEELPKYISNNLKPLSESSHEVKKLTSLQSITFGEGANEEVYSVDGFNCYPSGTDYDINISGTNLDPNLLLISLTPEYGATRARYNFRNLYEITDYIVVFSNKDQKAPTSIFVYNLIFLVSYKNHSRTDYV